MLSQGHVLEKVLSGDHTSEFSVTTTDDWQVSQVHESEDVEDLGETVVSEGDMGMVHHVWSHVDSLVNTLLYHFLDFLVGSVS